MARWIYPSPIEVIPGRSDPLFVDFAHAHLNLSDALNVGLSPLAIKCNEAWKPVLEKLGDRFGYAWEWVKTETAEGNEHYSPWGEAVLNKVGK